MEGPPPPSIDEGELGCALAESWGLPVGRLQYEPKGFGSYHWIAWSDDGRRWFVRLDGLEGKPYLGRDAHAALVGLEAAYATAHQLAESGLGFVVAPVPTLTGRVLVPMGPRWALSVHPFVDGAPGEWGRPGRPERRRALVRALAELHRTRLAVGSSVPHRGWELPGRADLDGAMEDLGRPWSGGPFSEPARAILQANSSLVRAWLDALDSLASAVAAAGPALVVTHGEPHPGNVLTAGGELQLVDWDTVARGPAERDLWMFDGDPSALELYQSESEKAVDHTAIELYRLTWALSDLAIFTAGFRDRHRRDPVTEKSWRGMLAILDGSEPAPYGRSPGRR